jgi:hypothetical protein
MRCLRSGRRNDRRFALCRCAPDSVPSQPIGSSFEGGMLTRSLFKTAYRLFGVVLLLFSLALAALLVASTQSRVYLRTNLPLNNRILLYANRGVLWCDLSSRPQADDGYSSPRIWSAPLSRFDIRCESLWCFSRADNSDAWGLCNFAGAETAHWSLVLRHAWIWPTGLLFAWCTPWAIARYKRTIRTRTGRCRRCGYSLRGLTSHRCPECGTTFRDPERTMPKP